MSASEDIEFSTTIKPTLLYQYPIYKQNKNFSEILASHIYSFGLKLEEINISNFSQNSIEEILYSNDKKYDRENKFAFFI